MTAQTRPENRESGLCGQGWGGVVVVVVYPLVWSLAGCARYIDAWQSSHLLLANGNAWKEMLGPFRSRSRSSLWCVCYANVLLSVSRDEVEEPFLMSCLSFLESNLIIFLFLIYFSILSVQFIVKSFINEIMIVSLSPLAPSRPSSYLL